MGFGKPKNTTTFKATPKSIQEGKPLCVRILPPILSCENEGIWSLPYAQHFGFSIKNPANPSKDIYYTFHCLEQVKWIDNKKVVVKPCAECEKIKEISNTIDCRKADLLKEGKTEEEINEILRPLMNWTKAHNRDFKHYVNVKDASGEYYTLRLTNELKKKVDAINKKLAEGKRPIDAIDAEQGVYFIFSRTGKGMFNTKYDVEVAKEEFEQNGEVFERIKLAPLTDADCDRAEQSCCDLRDVGIRTLTAEKIQMLVDSKGNEETIKAVFSSSEKTREPVEEAVEEIDPAAIKREAAAVVAKKAAAAAKADAEAVALAKTKAAEAAKVIEVPAEVQEEDDDIAQAMAALEAAKARKAAAKTVQVAPVAAPVAKVEPLKAAIVPNEDNGLSEEDKLFLEQYK